MGLKLGDIHRLFREHGAMADATSTSISPSRSCARFSAPVVEAIRLHVDAERALCSLEPAEFPGESPFGRRAAAAPLGRFGQGRGGLVDCPVQVVVLDRQRRRKADDGPVRVLHKHAAGGKALRCTSPSSSITRSASSPTAAAKGLPPNVGPWLPASNMLRGA